MLTNPNRTAKTIIKPLFRILYVFSLDLNHANITYQ